jgi:hypothetical protein
VTQKIQVLLLASCTLSLHLKLLMLYLDLLALYLKLLSLELILSSLYLCKRGSCVLSLSL